MNNNKLHVIMNFKECLILTQIESTWIITSKHIEKLVNISQFTNVKKVNLICFVLKGPWQDTNFLYIQY